MNHILSKLNSTVYKHPLRKYSVSFVAVVKGEVLTGGKNGNELASTTLRFFTPITFAEGSMTALGSVELPMAQVALAWYTVETDSRMIWRISASVETYFVAVLITVLS